MVKWKEIKGIRKDTLVNAACRYLNSTDFPDMKVMAAIIGIEEVEVEDSRDDAGDSK